MDPSIFQDGTSVQPDHTEQLALESKFRQLVLEEHRLAKLDSLQRKVADKEASVLKLRQHQQRQQEQ